jgi:AraC-like DNA-binding protein
MEQQSFLLTLTQSLHLVAFAPCVLMFFYLLATSQNPLMILTPVLFFVTLATSLIAPVLPAFLVNHELFLDILSLSELLIPAFSFLLILQFFQHNIPKILYWLVLLVPFAVGYPALSSMLNGGNHICLNLETCLQSTTMLKISHVISGGLIMMLITVTLARMSWNLDKNIIIRIHKYWLIIALIGFNIFLLALELSLIAGTIDNERYLFANVVFKLTFIYLVLTSLFRVFSEDFALDESFKLTYHHRPLREHEKELIKKLLHLLNQEKVFLEMGLGRELLAQKLHITEQQLSRIVNIRFKRSLSDLLNEYRINEAKKRLQNLSIPITTIAFDTGFSSMASFNRVFKKLVNCSPTDYRMRPRE